MKAPSSPDLPKKKKKTKKKHADMKALNCCGVRTRSVLIFYKIFCLYLPKKNFEKLENNCRGFMLDL